MDNDTEYPENLLFAQWRSSPEQEKEQLLARLTKALSTHAYSVCWLKMPDHRSEFPGVVNAAIWRAVKGAEKFRGESKFGSWFHRIVLNECNRVLKAKQGREVETSLEEMTSEIPVESDPDRKICLVQLLDDLGGEDRRVVEMKLEGMKDWEIAREIGTTESAVWNRWERIKGELRDGRMG